MFIMKNSTAYINIYSICYLSYKKGGIKIHMYLFMCKRFIQKKYRKHKPEIREIGNVQVVGGKGVERRRKPSSREEGGVTLFWVSFCLSLTVRMIVTVYIPFTHHKSKHIQKIKTGILTNRPTNRPILQMIAITTRKWDSKK